MINIKVKNTEFKPGRPKIAVPITGTTHEEIIEEVKEALNSGCEVIEWRADYYFSAVKNLAEKVENTDAHLEMIRILDDIDYLAGDVPVIFTLRGHMQGGQVAISRHHAFDLASLAAQSKLIDFVDFELFDDDDTFDEAKVRGEIEQVHKYGVKMILSYHDFNGAPTNEQIKNVVYIMRDLGADMCKIACAVSTKEAAAQLVKTTVELTAGEQAPIIMVGMGPAGLVTRVAGGRYGSVITFARGREATAPGQHDMATMKKLLDDYYTED